MSNLKPFTSEQSREKAVENGRKGGIASGISKRERRVLKESILDRMNEDDWNEMIDALIERAKESDKSFVVLRDTIGQKPIDRGWQFVDLDVDENKDESLRELEEYFARKK